MVMGTNDKQGMVLNNQSDFSAGSSLVSFLGAVILLASVNFFRRRRGTIRT